MSAWVMVIEDVDAETGLIFRRDRIVRHGWESPEAAVRNWTERGYFKRPGVEHYRNGKSERRDDMGWTKRVYFERVADRDWWVDGHYIGAPDADSAWREATSLYDFTPEKVRPWTDEDQAELEASDAPVL